MLSTLPLLLMLAGATPTPTLAPDTQTLNQSLREYKALKSREALLRIKISRGNLGQKDAFNREFETLKPKIYDAAQTMEYQVQQFERRHGAKGLCAALEEGLKPMVPACLPAKQ